jgi:Phage integrase, N-terminal SAM-like domain
MPRHIDRSSASSDHLPRLRGLSPHTIHNYRDSLVLLLRFLSARSKRPSKELPSP